MKLTLTAKFGKCVIFLAALIGFSVQIVQVSLQYFAYATTTLIAQKSISSTLPPQLISFCVPYRQVLDKKAQRFTVADILNLTLAVDDVFKSCRYRNKNGVMLTAGQSECNKLIKTSCFIASMEFVEYFSFVTSCFGVWFGVSFLSIISIMKQKKRRERHTRQRVGE